MKVIAINGSPRKGGNSATALEIIKNTLETHGIEMEIVQIGHKNIRGCVACGKCAELRNESCVVKDEVNEVVQKMKEADGIILASPVYFSGVAGTMKCFLDRAFYVSNANGNLFRHKVGAALVAVRRSGGTATLDSLNHYLMYSEMVVASSNYWNVMHGRAPKEVEQDTEGIQTLRILANNMAWIMQMKSQTANSISAPTQEAKEWMHFIR